MLGFAQTVTVAVFGSLIVVFVAFGVLLDHVYRLAFEAAGIFLFDFDASFFIWIFACEKIFCILDGLVDFTLQAGDFTLGQSLGVGFHPADSTLDRACFRLQTVVLGLMLFHVRFQGFGGMQVEGVRVPG